MTDKSLPRHLESDDLAPNQHDPDAQAAAIQPSELEAWKVVAAIADTMLWPCRRHEPKGCGENCTACRMVDALHAVGLGHDLKKGTNP